MKNIQLLHGDWLFKSAEDTQYSIGRVPGTVLTDMLHAGQIEDPFWRTNEYAVRQRMEQDYVYRRTFIVPPASLGADAVELVCEGLDTLAAITLNGTLLAQADNMHCTYRLGIKGILTAGKNEIEIVFSSPLKFVQEEDARNDIHYASTGCMPGNAALRKAHYMFGWDWGPQLPDMGVFRSIYIEYIHKARLKDVRITQQHRPEQQEVLLEVEAQADLYTSQHLEVLVTVTAPGGQQWHSTGAVGAALQVKVTQPQLWWPNGLGGQPLYEVKVQLAGPDGVEDCQARRIGLRTITVSTQPDEWGSEFAFVVNGHKIFAMGANYIPQDNLIPRVTEQHIRGLVADCARANFNCIRVWGGGYYPDDVFYDACDEYGILVWQDLMFACNVYALNQHFEENIIAEIRDNVCRLRHHACLALWCGNNEMEWGWGEGWKRILGHPPRYKADYLKIFEMIVPRALEQYDSSTFFWPSSPSSGGAYDYPNDPDRGDQHYWDVWHSGKPFTEYRASHFRFCSEYGFQSFPHYKTMQSFTLPQDRNIFSEVMESHQKNGQANSKIFTYVSEYFLYPKNLAAIGYISQILQLKAVQYGVEHWRRNRGRCMGSLYWQLNDCWPVASWASIDYYGRWKALHYGAKRFYAPVMASACEKQELDTNITYFAHNDSLHAEALELQVQLIDTLFTVLYDVRVRAEVPPLSVARVLEEDFAHYINGAEQRKRVFAQYRLFKQGRCISSGLTMFVKPKHFAYPQVTYEKSVEDKGDCFAICVKASGFAHFTEVGFTHTDGVLEDNYVDITSPEGIVLHLDKAKMSVQKTAEQLAEEIVVYSVADSFRIEEEIEWD